MKKYIFIALAAVITFFTSCSDNDSATLDGLKVSQSYVSLPVKGGSASITIESNSDWVLTCNSKEKDKKTGKMVTADDSWLKKSETQGTKGETTLTFSADETEDGRSLEYKLTSGSETQYINVLQGLSVVSEATCADVIAGPDKKTYKVTGVVSNISNTVYGNWDLVDATGKVYIYGTLDSKGGTKNFLSLGLEEGDEVTLQGPKTTYGTTVELVDVTVLKINKSLIKVDSVYNEKLPAEGGIFESYIITKGNGVSVEIPEDAKEWLSIASIDQKGTNACIKFRAAKNEGGDRSTSITFKTTDGKKDYICKTELSQEGSIINATVDEFLKAEVGLTQYRVTGVVSKIDNPKYGNIHIKDYSGEVYIYGTNDFASYNLKVGDVVTLVGPRSDYNGTAQMKNASVEKVVSVKAATVSEFLAAPESKTQYYMLTGKVAKIIKADYGNLDLEDETGTVLVYGLFTGWGGAKQQFASLNIVEGDKITIIGTRTSYNGTNEVGNGVFITKVTE